MSKIRLYTTDNNIEDDDKVVGTDVTGNHTKNYEMSAIRSYVGSTSVLTTKVTLTSEQLLSLNTEDTVELIEAPGAGKVIVPISIVGFLDFNTTSYNFSNNIGITLGTTTYTEILPSRINASADNYFSTTVAPSSNLSVNSALNLYYLSPATVTQGDSPLTISITYRIVDFS